MKLPEKLQFAPNGDSENIYNMLLKINAIIDYLKQYEQQKPKGKCGICRGENFTASWDFLPCDDCVKKGY